MGREIRAILRLPEGRTEETMIALPPPAHVVIPILLKDGFGQIQLYLKARHDDYVIYG